MLKAGFLCDAQKVSHHFYLAITFDTLEILISKLSSPYFFFPRLLSQNSDQPKLDRVSLCDSVASESSLLTENPVTSQLMCFVWINTFMLPVRIHISRH